VPTVLLLTACDRRPDEVLPALRDLPYSVRVQPEPAHAALADAVLVDARHDLCWARDRCRTVGASALGRPLLAVFDAADLVALNPGWLVDDVVLTTACPGEVSMRLRLAADRHREPAPPKAELGTELLRLNRDSRTVLLCDRPVRLTYAEFEILSCLARKPGQVVTHHSLLDHLYDGEPRGTTRAVQTHIRRIRAKFGPEFAPLIQTSHGIGYRLEPDQRRKR
jgi:DNA-binding response OmpR family regulator